MAVGLFAKVAGAWVEIGGGSGIEWAKVSGGTVTTYTKADGSVMEVHTFTANGTLTVDSPGYAEVFMIGGGGPGWNYWGSGGRTVEGIHLLPAGPQSVVIGTGVAGDPNSVGIGLPSYLGSLRTGVAGQYVGAGGTTWATRGNEITTSISGTPVTYGRAGSVGSPRANKGDGGWSGDNSAGSSGIVIVAVQKSAPTISSVIASGGTETQYTGNGSNGVNGQKYKVHTFTADGTFTVTQGGEADVLVVGPGYSTSSNGNGGPVILNRMTLPVGSHSVVIGVSETSQGSGGDKATRLGSIAGAGVCMSGASDKGNDGLSATANGVVSPITGASHEYGAGGSRKATLTNAADRYGIGGDPAISNRAGGGFVAIRYEVA